MISYVVYIFVSLFFSLFFFFCFLYIDVTLMWYGDGDDDGVEEMG